MIDRVCEPFLSATVQRQRRFPERILKTGEPHLLVVPPGNACATDM